MSGNIIDIWETPFKEARDPSVGLVTETSGEASAMLVVAPHGLDEYPKFLVHFSDVLAASYCEEAGATVSFGQEDAPDNICCYIWRSSPHVASYNNTIFYSEHLTHYVVFGGDNIASVICSGMPKIEEVSTPKTLSVTYEI